MHITILTLFPEIFNGVFESSILGKSLVNNIWSLDLVNIRDFAESKNKEVDDKTYGGGRGRIIRADVLAKCLDNAILKMSETPRIIYTSPRGKLITQNKIRELSDSQNIIFICGRYEGIDQRIIDAYNVEEISIGDFVLTGGEIPVMAIVDAVVRLLPGTIKNTEFDDEESFNNNLLEYDQFTIPADVQINGKVFSVPHELTSGNHSVIQKYRYENSKIITAKKRPDIWAKFVKSKFEK